MDIVWSLIVTTIPVGFVFVLFFEIYFGRSILGQEKRFSHLSFFLTSRPRWQSWGQGHFGWRTEQEKIEAVTHKIVCSNSHFPTTIEVDFRMYLFLKHLFILISGKVVLIAHYFLGCRAWVLYVYYVCWPLWCMSLVSHLPQSNFVATFSLLLWLPQW